MGVNMEGFVGKKVYIVLKNKRVYIAKIIEVNSNMISGIDKFGKQIVLNIDSISSIEEEDEKYEK